MKYDVYFEIYGKKLKTTIEAVNENEAKKIIKEKIIFHKIELIKKTKEVNEPQFDVEDLKSIFGIK